MVTYIYYHVYPYFMNQEKRAIEFVGYGGLGREELARIITADLIKQKGLEDKIEVISSGTHILGVTANPDQMDNYKRKIVRRAFDRKLFSNQNYVEFALGNDNISKISDYFTEVLPRFKDEEQQYLNEALQYFKMDGKVIISPNSTIALSNTKNVFCMEKDNEIIVNNFYIQHNNFPKIDLIFHGEEKINGAFGRTQKEYIKMFEQVKTYVETNLPQIIQKLL